MTSVVADLVRYSNCYSSHNLYVASSASNASFNSDLFNFIVGKFSRSKVKTMERVMVFLINIFCPPLSVMLVAGVGPDCLINTLFFLAGVLPGHLHGFYITCTYFYRKRKVCKGRYPGGRKAGIHSERVWNGGASNARVQELWERERRKEREGGRERNFR